MCDLECVYDYCAAVDYSFDSSFALNLLWCDASFPVYVKVLAFLGALVCDGDGGGPLDTSASSSSSHRAAICQLGLLLELYQTDRVCCVGELYRTNK